MTDKFDKLSERARQVLVYAQEEARGFWHNYIGTEHQLLGLIRVEEGLAAQVLRDLGAEPDVIRAAVERVLGRGTEAPEGEIALTPRARKVVDLALDEARRLRHPYVGTEHLLLGMLREGDGVAAQILAGLGIGLDDARRQTLHLLTDGTPDGMTSIRRMVADWKERDRGVKRYNLALPEELFAEVQALADRQHTTVVELLRRFIKLGLLATEIQDRPQSALIIREGEREREIVLL